MEFHMASMDNVGHDCKIFSGSLLKVGLIEFGVGFGRKSKNID